jgi:hypothetical protein
VERAGCRGRLVEDEVMFRGAVEEDNWQACHCRDLVSGMEKGNDVYLVYARYAVDMGVVDERYLGRDMQGVRVSYALRGLAFIHARVRVGVTYPLLFSVTFLDNIFPAGQTCHLRHSRVSSICMRNVGFYIRSRAPRIVRQRSVAKFEVKMHETLSKY